MDHYKFQILVRNLYETVSKLEGMFPGRHFTPDGHMVGSLGECLVADAYGLELMPASNKGYDAETKDGKKVEIKATQSRSVAFRSCPEHTIIIKIMPNGTFEEFYNGPGSEIWKCFDGKKMPSNGQFQISINKAKLISESLPESTKIPKAPFIEG